MAFPVDEKYIEKAEVELNIEFPNSFKIKMMSLNGGSVMVGDDYFDIHPFYDTSDKKRIKRTCNSIVRETKNAWEFYRLPRNLIVIGNNGGGDVLVYRIEPNGLILNNVYWYDHETESLILAATDFSELSESV